MRDLSFVQDYANPRSIGFRLRKRRRGRLQALIESVYDQNGSVNIIDLGGVPEYWKIFDEDYLVSRKIRITALNIGSIGATGSEIFVEQIGDACDVRAFADNAFDIVH